MSDILNTIKYLVNKEVEEILFTGNVTSLDPLQVKLSPSDDAINVRMLNVFGIKVGSNVLMVKYLSKFVVVGVIGNVAQSFCLLQRTTAQSIPANTDTFMNFSSGTNVLDPESMFDGTDKITIPSDGLYQVNFQFRVADYTGTTTRLANLYLNGDQIASITASPDGAGRYGANFLLNLNLSANDYLQVVLFFGSTLNIGDYDNTYFSVVPINSGSAIQPASSVDSTTKVVVKQSSQGSTTSGSFTTDSELQVILEANKLYKIKFNLIVNNANTTPDMIVNFDNTGTVTLYGQNHFRCMSATGTNAAAYEEGKTSTYDAFDDDIIVGLASGYASARSSFLAKGGATGGSITLLFKQRYTDGSNASYVRAGSYIEYYEVEEV